MKIFDKKHPTLFKIDLMQQPDHKETLTLCDSTFDHVYQFVSRQISKYGSSIKKGRSTQVRIRETIAGKTTKGKDKSISFYGSNPKEMYDIIVYVILNEK